MLKNIQQRLAAISYPIRTITAALAAEEMSNNQGCLIDVREPAEVQNEPVDGALNIPRGVLEMKMLEQFLDEGKPIYIHCASGVRAQLSAEQLLNMGYTNVTVITCNITQIKQHF
ncbi:rhodanese-like domain-containing protein [Alteromonas sp. C1M14]|uniref:rhodanese-like domain-containing protein n=1 Tax=Alteromonas sp. C1M14 TaxID=2841567 RepID=UPI001C09151F|nr:rhodanese-like domain-containing protein [Alteromonas sp. C1M14]MBU2977164.1 rhodanese-like domain-containing protein [Alteromonas sp. C1M14]